MTIAYISAQFPDTQLKCSMLVKEGYAIYLCSKEMETLLRRCKNRT